MEEKLVDETRIYVPAESDCWGKCRWCYYCIKGELAKHQLAHSEAGRVGQQVNGSVKQSEKDLEKTEKWTCLRCGGGVSIAWRVGPDIESTAARG